MGIFGKISKKQDPAWLWERHEVIASCKLLIHMGLLENNNISAEAQSVITLGLVVPTLGDSGEKGFWKKVQNEVSAISIDDAIYVLKKMTRAKRTILLATLNTVAYTDDVDDGQYNGEMTEEEGGFWDYVQENLDPDLSIHKSGYKL